MKAKAKIGVILPQIKELPLLPEAGRSKGEFFRRDVRGSMVLLTL